MGSAVCTCRHPAAATAPGRSGHAGPRPSPPATGQRRRDLSTRSCATRVSGRPPRSRRPASIPPGRFQHQPFVLVRVPGPGGGKRRLPLSAASCTLRRPPAPRCCRQAPPTTAHRVHQTARTSTHQNRSTVPPFRDPRRSRCPPTPPPSKHPPLPAPIRSPNPPSAAPRSTPTLRLAYQPPRHRSPLAAAHRLHKRHRPAQPRTRPLTLLTTDCPPRLLRLQSAEPSARSNLQQPPESQPECPTPRGTFDWDPL